MPLTAAVLKSVATWDVYKSNTGFKKTRLRDSLAGSYTSDGTTFNQILVAQYSLAASGTQTVDLYSFTNIVNESVTATKFKGILLKATATVTGGQLAIEPGASNPFPLGLSGTSPVLTLDVGTDGCEFLIRNGTTMTVSSTVRNVKLSNPGTQTITVSVFSLLGT